MACTNKTVYLVKEVVDTVKRDLGLNDHRDVIESHPHLVSQRIKDCRNELVQWSEFEGNHGIPDIAEKTFAAVISSFMMIVCT